MKFLIKSLILGAVVFSIVAFTNAQTCSDLKYFKAKGWVVHELSEFPVTSRAALDKIKYKFNNEPHIKPWRYWIDKDYIYIAEFDDKDTLPDEMLGDYVLIYEFDFDVRDDWELVGVRWYENGKRHISLKHPRKKNSCTYMAYPIAENSLT